MQEMRLANLHISWVEHFMTVGYVFEKLRKNRQTANCTLSAEGQEMSVHKDVLSTCSDYFKVIFQERRENPLVTLMGISFQDLVCLMEFMYSGKMVVTSNRLESVLRVAKHLRIKGLSPCVNGPLSASNEVQFQQIPFSVKRSWNVNVGFSMQNGVRRLEFRVEQFGLKRETEDVDMIMPTGLSERVSEGTEQSRPMFKMVDNDVIVLGDSLEHCNEATEQLGPVINTETSPMVVADMSGSNETRKQPRSMPSTKDDMIVLANASKHRNKAAKRHVPVRNTIVIDTSKSTSEVTEQLGPVFNAEDDDDDDVIVLADSCECCKRVAEVPGLMLNAKDDHTVADTSEHTNEATEQSRPLSDTEDDDVIMLDELSKHSNEAAEQSTLMPDKGDGSVTIGVSLGSSNETTEQSELISDAENGDLAVLSDFSESDSEATILYMPSDNSLDCKKKFSENVQARCKSAVVLDCLPPELSSRVQNMTCSSRSSNPDLPSYLNPRVLVHRIKATQSLLHSELVPQAEVDSSLHNGGSSEESDHNSLLEGQLCDSTEIASKQSVGVNITATVAGDSSTAASSSVTVRAWQSLTQAKIERSQGKFSCLLCHKVFRRSEALEVHLLNHTGRRQKHSSPAGEDKEEMVKGMPKRRGNAKMSFRCQKCNFHTEHLSSLERHKVLHTGDKPFRCSVCDFATAWNYSLKIHQRTHSGFRPYKCTECKFASTNASGLRRHKMVHIGETPFKCTECDFASVHYDGLKKHRFTHTGETPYKCPECDFATAWQGNLRDHVRNHRGERPYKCHICDYSSSRASNLKHHMVRHSEVRKYKCSKCDYAAKWKEQLKEHEACHSNEKRYNCHVCNYGTSRRSDFQRHMHIRAMIKASGS